MECLESQSHAPPKNKSSVHLKSRARRARAVPPEEPFPKSKSRARAVLADDPELCLPKQQSEEPVPCLARYPHVRALMGLSNVRVLKCIPMELHSSP